MSTYDRTNTTALTTSDEPEATRITPRIRRAERRRDRHNVRRELHVTAQVSIRRLLAGAA